MFVAGGLIWANMTSRRKPPLSPGTYTAEDINRIISEGVSGPISIYNNGFRYGWPRDSLVLPVTKKISIDQSGLEHSRENEGAPISIVNLIPDKFIFLGADTPASISKGTILWKGALIDFASSFAILLTVWFLSEWLIRRSAARKGA